MRHRCSVPAGAAAALGRRTETGTTWPVIQVVNSVPVLMLSRPQLELSHLQCLRAVFIR